jgi:hypothetical protein
MSDKLIDAQGIILNFSHCCESLAVAYVQPAHELIICSLKFVMVRCTQEKRSFGWLEGPPGALRSLHAIA